MRLDITTALEAYDRAETSLNSAERSLEQGEAAERFVLKGQDKAVEERELTEQVMKQVRGVSTVTDEGQTYYRKADSATESAHRLATLACQELEYRVGKLRAFNSPSSLTQNAAIAFKPPKSSRLPNPSPNKRPTGAGYADPDERAEATYKQIRGMRDDVPQIAANLDIPENIVSAVRNHVFIEEHDIAVGAGQVDRQRFAADPEIAELWISAIRGTLSGDDLYTFQRIFAHEYVEQALMKRGLPFRSSHPEAWKKGYNKATSKHYGAHDLAPLCDIMRDPFEHWKLLGLAATQLPTGDLELSKLEALVKIIEALIL
ncbi:MAG: hypothetical protein SXA11_03480 [Cyanobacteriota bacterium]|nr:hypothetical protein [Cyanobacteriota bacterium]